MIDGDDLDATVRLRRANNRFQRIPDVVLLIVDGDYGGDYDLATQGVTQKGMSGPVVVTGN